MPAYKKVSTLYDSSIKIIYKVVYSACKILKDDSVEDKTGILENLNMYLRYFLHGR